MFLVIVFFVFASFLTIFSAIKLSKYGDQLASVTKLGHGLVGFFLLSTATSLPELFASGSASFIGNVDLAFGNVFGSNMTNVFILFTLDFFFKKEPIMLQVSERNIMTGGLFIFFNSFVMLLIFISHLKIFSSKDFWYFPIFIFIGYFICMRFVFFYEKFNVSKNQVEKVNQNIIKYKSILGFIFSTIGVVISAIILSYSSNQISQIEFLGKSLGGTFVGTLLMACVTSLPEFVVTITAVKINCHDMALGNLFGSNLFNLLILSFSDWFFRLGNFVKNESIQNSFSESNPNHFISGFVGLILVSIVIMSIKLRSKKQLGIVGYDTLLIAIFYFLGFYLLYYLR